MRQAQNDCFAGGIRLPRLTGKILMETGLYWLTPSVLCQVFGEGLLGQGVRLVEDVTQVVDGERDPRCLLVAFDLIRAVVTLYSTHNPRSLE